VTWQPSSILRLLGIPLAWVAIFIVIGGHWAVLQGIAWSRMVVDYTGHTRSLVTGVERTFSGNYPCPMCCKIAAERQKQEKSPQILEAAKKPSDFIPSSTTAVVPPCASDFSYFSGEALLSPQCILGPPLPVPRQGNA
jgi:hypothetical protein